MVKIFVETFQGYFKDGLGDTVDCRMIPGIMLLGAGLIALVVSLTNDMSSQAPFFGALEEGYIFIVVSLAVSYLRPCKSLLMNISLSFHFTVMGIAGIMLTLWEQDSFISSETLAIELAVLAALPHILMSIWAAYNMSRYIYSKCQCNPERNALKCWAWLCCRQHDLLPLLPKERDNSQQLCMP